MIFKGQTIDGEPVTQWPMIHKECAKHDRFAVTVEKWSDEREISIRQMKYLHAVVFKRLAEKMHCSLLWAEITLKRACGEQWLVKRVDKAEIILSKTILSVKQTNEWIKNIQDWCGSINLHIPEPNPEWRKEKENEL